MTAPEIIGAPHLTAWYDRVMARPSAAETVPPPMPGRG
jgi:glutathione S-transferase